MAVKKHKLVSCNRNQLDLATLAQYFQTMNDQTNYFPPLTELVKHCQDIVKCLSRTPGTAEQLWQLLQPVEQFLFRTVTTVHTKIRHEIFTTILDKFYFHISDPQSDACPATAAVLIVIDESDEDTALSLARWLVQRTENGPTGAGLRASLSCLYRWLLDWDGTPALGFWILAYIKALEEYQHFDILIETSLDHLAMLFSCMAKPTPMHQTTANVIFHILASLRESIDAFHRISPNVGEALMNLASDSGHWSRQLLQDLVDILTVMVDRITRSLKGDAQLMFRDKYMDVILCLERHLAPCESDFLQIEPWPVRNMFQAGANSVSSTWKVGLLNLGNTCYMNSVIQALLVTRQFSTHAMLKMLSIPYWEKIGELFAYMVHSASSKLDPRKFFMYLKPPFFSTDNQHDSSEFLGYFLELLQSHEHLTDARFDYSRPEVVSGNARPPIVPLNTRVRPAHPTIPQPTPLGDMLAEAAQNRRSVSPRPSGSGCGGSGSSGTKRGSPPESALVPPKKRPRPTDSTVLRRDSIIDGMFGGVLLTRVQCTVCRASSLSRDVFRDLQLAFPEKPEGQHSVQSLLEYYCSKESLSGDNKYQCNDCGGLRDAEKSVIIETTPKFLILVLKNFKFDSKQLVQTKLMHYVYYNETVTLPTVRTRAVHSSYNLFAAVVHAGTTLDSGHYYTIAKDKGLWHKYNDCTVSFIGDSQLNKLNRSSTPYILFYRRSDIEESISPSLDELSPRLREKIKSDNKLYIEAARKMQLTRP